MSAPVGTRFVAKIDFFSEELQSAYCIGLGYQVREGNNVLADLVPQWEADGKIEIVDAAIPVGATIEGKG